MNIGKLGIVALAAATLAAPPRRLPPSTTATP